MQEYRINLGIPKIEDIFCISLVVQNNELIEIFQEEIKELNLVFEKELKLSDTGIVRCLKGGLLKVALKEKYDNLRSMRQGRLQNRNYSCKKEIEHHLKGFCAIKWLIILTNNFWREDIEVPYLEKNVEVKENGCVTNVYACSCGQEDEDRNLLILLGDKSECKSEWVQVSTKT